MNTSSKKKAAIKLFREARKLRKKDKDDKLKSKRIEMYEQVLTLDPEHFGSLRYLGITAYSDRQYQKALDYYRRAEKINPAHPDLQYNLAAAIYCLNEAVVTDEIRNYLNQALIDNPKDRFDNWFVLKYASSEALTKAKIKMDRSAKLKNNSWLLFPLAVGFGLSGFTQKMSEEIQTDKALESTNAN